MFSFVFSGTETSFFTLKYWKIERLKVEDSISARLIVRLVENPTFLLATLLIGNESVNVTMSSLFARLKLSIFPEPHPMISVGAILVSTGLTLFAGEITPKIIGLKRPEMFARNVAWILFLMQKVLLARGMADCENGTKGSPIQDRTFGPRNCPSRRFSWPARKGDILLHRSDVRIAEDSRPLRRHPRKQIQSLKDMKKRDHVFLPERQSVAGLVAMFQSDPTIDCVFLVDEFGDISGIADRDSLIRFFTLPPADCYFLSDKTITPDFPVPVFEYLFEIRLTEKRFRTIGGYVFHLFGHVPETGNRVQDGLFQFTPHIEGHGAHHGHPSGEVVMIELTIFAIAVACEAFFSGSEHGIVVADTATLHMMEKRGNYLASLVLTMKRNPDMLLSITLPGTNLAAVTASFMGTMFFINRFPEIQAYCVLFIIPIMLTFGELLPKTLFSLAPEHLSIACVRPLMFLARLFTPVTWALGKYKRLIDRMIPADEDVIRKEELDLVLGNEIRKLPRPVRESLEAHLDGKSIGEALFPDYRNR
ncbi:MAG: CNNM domain-containing protein [Desulfobacterales bacterium]|nr:CNNM domain-containing protein [Desulfobacterales bacterium]